YAPLFRSEPLAGAIWIGRQTKVEGDHRRLFGAQQGDGSFAITGGEDLIAFVSPAQLTLQAGIILDDQQLGQGHGFVVTHAACSTSCRTPPAVRSSTLKRVPRPSALSTSIRPPISSASFCASNAPSPNPPGLDETNGLNSFSRTKAGDMPLP